MAAAEEEQSSCQECEILSYENTFFSQPFNTPDCASLNKETAEKEFDYWPNIDETEDPMIEEGIEEGIEEVIEEVNRIPKLDNEKIGELTQQLRDVQTEIQNRKRTLIPKIMDLIARPSPDKYLLLLSLLTAAQQSFLKNKDEKVLSLIISLTSSLTILIRYQSSNKQQLTEKEADIREKISELLLGPRKIIIRRSSEPSRSSESMCSSLMNPLCSDSYEMQNKKVTISLDEAKTRLLTGLDVTDAYLDTITVHVGELSTGSSEEEATIGRLLQCAIYTYRQVLEHDPVDTANIVDNLNNNNDKNFNNIRKLGSLLGRLMHLCGRLSVSSGSAIVGVTIRIIRSIHNGLFYSGLYPYVITASIVYYARYEIAAGMYEFGKQGFFYILRTTVAQQGLAWLKKMIKEQATQAATEAARQTAQTVVAEAAADQTRQRITNAVALRVLEYVANPQNFQAIAAGAANLAIGNGGGGKRKRTKKRKRRRRGGSKKTKRRGKKSKKGGKRRRGGSKKRNRRSQRKTKK